MSSQMMIAVMRAPWFEDGREVAGDWEYLVEVGVSRLAAHEFKDSDYELMDAADALGIEYEDLPPSADSVDAAVFHARVRGEVRTALEAFLKSLFTADRRNPEVTYLETGPNEKWIATGGLSWGDAPTDAYEPITVLDRIGLYDAALPPKEFSYDGH